MTVTAKPWPAMLATGAVSAPCYFLLFANEKEVMAAFTRSDGWYPALPVFMALVFSPVHALTSRAFIIAGAMLRGYRQA